MLCESCSEDRLCNYHLETRQSTHEFIWKFNLQSIPVFFSDGNVKIQRSQVAESILELMPLCSQTLFLIQLAMWTVLLHQGGKAGLAVVDLLL